MGDEFGVALIRPGHQAPLEGDARDVASHDAIARGENGNMVSPTMMPGTATPMATPNDEAA